MTVMEKKTHLKNLLTHYGTSEHDALQKQQLTNRALRMRQFSEGIFIGLLQIMNALFDHTSTTSSILALGLTMNLIVLFWRGKTLWKYLLLGNLFFWSIQLTNLPTAFVLSMFTTLNAWLIIYFTHRWLGPLFPLGSISALCTFIAIAITVTFCCAYSQSMLLITDPMAALRVGSHYALRSLNGVLLIFPAMMIWSSYPFLFEYFGAKKTWRLLATSVINALLLASLLLNQEPAVICCLFAFWAVLTCHEIKTLGIHSVCLTLLFLSAALLTLSALNPVWPNLTPPLVNTFAWCLLISVSAYSLAIYRQQARRSNGKTP